MSKCVYGFMGICVYGIMRLSVYALFVKRISYYVLFLNMV